MSRQAVISLPLSFAIVLVAAIGLSGTIRDGEEGRSGAIRYVDGTIADPIGPVKAEKPAPGPPAGVEPTPDPPPLPPAEAPADHPIEPRPDLPRVIVTRPGESLLSVAERAYGSAEMAGPMLDANPSLLVEPWRPLPGGTVLTLP